MLLGDWWVERLVTEVYGQPVAQLPAPEFGCLVTWIALSIITRPMLMMSD